MSNSLALNTRNQIQTTIGLHVCWAIVLLLSAGTSVRAERLPISVYNTASGLAHNGVNRIVKDSRGFLWLCTGDGLSRFDGYAFVNFGTAQGLPHPSVTDFLETRGGEYWIATGAGVVRFDPDGTPDRHFVAENEVGPRAPMFAVVVPRENAPKALNVAVLLEGRDGTIWAGTGNGLYRLAGDKGRRTMEHVPIGIPTEYAEQRAIADLLEDKRGSLWIAAPSGLYRRWSDGSAARYTTRDRLPGDDLNDLFEDHEGHFWAGSRLTGFFRFSTDGARGAPVVDRQFNFPQLPTSWVFQIFQTSDRRFWIASARGLLEFFPEADVQGRRFRAYGEENGLTDYNIKTLAEDLAGNLWLGTGAGGAVKLSRGGFTTFGKEDGIQVVNAVFEDRSGGLCFKGSVLGDSRTSLFEGGQLDTSRGDRATIHSRFGCFDGRRFDWFKPAIVSDLRWERGWVKEGVTLQARSGEWWVGTAEGLYRYRAVDSLRGIRRLQPRRVYTERDGLAALQVYRLFEDSHGNIWVATTASATNGLARWDRTDDRLRSLAGAPGLPSLKDDLPRTFAEDGFGGVWIGFSGGLVLYRHGGFRLFTARDGLPAGAIVDLHVDRAGRLWLASSRSGLIRVDDIGSEAPTFVRYTTSDGLSSDLAQVIGEDADGHLYVGGGRGLDRLDPSTGRIKHFTAADGLLPGAFNDAFRDRNGALWFGMSFGLARLEPGLERPAAPPPVMISGLRIAGEPQRVSALGTHDMSLPEIAFNRNQLQIDFVGLGFGPGEVLRYEYVLEGAPTSVRVPSEQRTVTFASLAPGRYRFMVRAVNSDGMASAQPAVITFTILRPFWLRSWFLAVTALATGSILFGLHRYRVRRLLAIVAMRSRIATDLHDDIGANLTRIVLLSEVARREQDDAPNRHVRSAPGASDRQPEDGPLASIASIARESVGSMSDIVWAINPERETLLDLTRRMRQHADEVFTLRDIVLHFHAPDLPGGLKLYMDVRRDLLLIFKEAVNNAARHSGCSRAEVRIQIDGSRVLLSVSDNGTGFDASRASEGQGLASMRRRAARRHGRLEIVSSPDAGTRVTLELAV